MDNENNVWEPFTGHASTADVWIFFEKNKNKKEARCMKCKKVLKISTSTMKYHIEKTHKLKLEESNAIKEKTSSDQPTLNKFFNRPGAVKREESGRVLAEMAAVDNLSFHSLATSNQLRKGFEARKLEIPTSVNGVKRHVFKYASDTMSALKQDLATRLEKNERFSLSLDEYTSPGNRR